MGLSRALILTAAALLAATVARSGHELPVYPSYYPHEIEIAAMAPGRAGELMRAGKLHAYVGGPMAFAAAPGDTVGTVESLGAFIVVRLNPDSQYAKDEASACAAAGAIARDVAARAGGTGFVAHPYPVTPFHGDYLAHADRAEAARRGGTAFWAAMRCSCPETSRCARADWREIWCARSGRAKPPGMPPSRR